MPTLELPADLRASLEEALRVLGDRAPSQLRDLINLRRALDAGSPIIRQRYLRLVEDAATDDIPADERRLLARVGADLTEYFDGRRGPRASRDNAYRTMIELSPEERDLLERLQARLGPNTAKAEVVRRGLAALERELGD